MVVYIITILMILKVRRPVPLIMDHLVVPKLKERIQLLRQAHEVCGV